MGIASRVFSCVAAFGVFSGVAGTAQAQWLELVGYPAGGVGSRVYALTPDGQTAAGGVFATPAGGFTWTRQDGRNDFGQLPGMPTASFAYGISTDGQFVAGSTSSQAYRYHVGDTALEFLGVLNGAYTTSYSQGISGDGQIVVGNSRLDFSDNVGQAFRWTSSTGMVGLGFTQPGSAYSEAAAISRDGSTTVGHSRQANGGYNDAFVWTESLGMRSLPGLSSTNDARAFGINHDGSIIVGDSSALPGVNSRQAVRWTGGIPTSLGVAPGFSFSSAIAVNDTGSVIVGKLTGQMDTAAIWTPERGMEPLADYLALHGVTVPAGVNLLTATSVSADGRTFAGYTGIPGQVRDGFVATIPSPSILPACAFGAAFGLMGRRR
ncbi:hypothetical protein PHYC_01666 [Phycisphaerales bacterium]|nr:hypothetical protein PHYC_01666 [Phycisphaerales bacterium]